jgi:CRP-like cAMP-binding protein
MATILLIEDNDEIRENTAEILELANYKVLTAGNGKIGVQLALDNHPDLIVCDITMPVLDGYGVLHVLHKNEQLQHVPFIFLTARSERTDIRKGMELGADDYITKPFDPTELLNAIEGRLKRASLVKQPLTADIDGLHTLLSAVSSLQSLREDRNVNKYKKKQVIYAEGNHPSFLFYLLSGKVKAYRRNDDGKELITGLYAAGDFMGYLPLLEGGNYRDNAEAMEDAELAVIPRDEFETLANNNPGVMQQFMRMLSGNIREKEEQLLGLAYNSLRKKVADAIVALVKKYATSTIDISRDNLAAIAGVAKESLIRTLGDFREEGLLQIKDGVISVVNVAKLENMLN